MREEYEAWFIGKFGYPPMPIHSRVMDFCWHGYQAGRKNSESDIDQLRQKLADLNRICEFDQKTNEQLLEQRDQLIDQLAATNDEFQSDIQAAAGGLSQTPL